MQGEDDLLGVRERLFARRGMSCDLAGAKQAKHLEQHCHIWIFKILQHQVLLDDCAFFKSNANLS